MDGFPRVNRAEASIILKLHDRWWMPAGDDFSLRFGSGEYATGGRRARVSKATVRVLKHKGILQLAEKEVQPGLFGQPSQTATRWELTELGRLLAEKLAKGIVPTPPDASWSSYKQEPRNDHMTYVQFCLWQDHRIKLFRMEIAHVLTQPSAEKAGEVAWQYVRTNHFSNPQACDPTTVKPGELAMLIQKLYREVLWA